MQGKQDAGQIFALDIGTRSIIGIVGQEEKGRFHVAAIEKEEHGRRAMLDGQIVEIQQVAEVAKAVVRRLEAKTQTSLNGCAWRQRAGPCAPKGRGSAWSSQSCG